MPTQHGADVSSVTPALSDVVWSLIPLTLVGALAALFIAALVSISRRASLMSRIELLGWLVLVVVAQFIGPLVWFALGRERYRRLSGDIR